jgi:hypothetical protein
MGILLGITTSWARNPPEEWNCAGNYKLIDIESTRGMEIPQEITSLFTWIQADKIKMRGKSF